MAMDNSRSSDDPISGNASPSIFSRAIAAEPRALVSSANQRTKRKRKAQPAKSHGNSSRSKRKPAASRAESGNVHLTPRMHRPTDHSSDRLVDSQTPLYVQRSTSLEVPITASSHKQQPQENICQSYSMSAGSPSSLKNTLRTCKIILIKDEEFYPCSFSLPTPHY